ncbi:hypothetical protein HN747_02660 [archaeon]|jgi:hypothetical protein|nr:hypothetical protein [archaeon]
MKYATYILVMGFGLLISIGTFLKLAGIVKIDSDWFWFLAGLGLLCEGSTSFFKQKKFDRKYKIIERE